MWLLLGSLALGAAPAVDDDAVASLTQPLAEGFARPDRKTVREFWTRSGQRATPMQVFRGEARQGRKTWEGVFTVRGGEPVLLFATDEAADDNLNRWLREGEAVATGTGWRIGKTTLERTWTAPDVGIDRALWSSWTYVGVLAEFQGPLYDAPVEAGDEDGDTRRDLALAEVVAGGDAAEIRAAIEQILASPYGDHDWRWERALDAAKGIGANDLMLSIHRHYRPYGRCSMDTWPEEVARQYADVCFAEGKTSCAVQLQVKAMDYWAFDRMAWSSYGEAASETGVDRLDAMGLDVPTFLLGLALDYDGVDDVGISLQRLGRAVHETGERKATMAAFDRVARDPAVDEYNRLTAAIVLANAHQYAGTELDRSGLSPTAKVWLDRD